MTRYDATLYICHGIGEAHRLSPRGTEAGSRGLSETTGVQANRAEVYAGELTLTPGVQSLLKASKNAIREGIFRQHRSFASFWTL